ncbi:MAG: tetratricopeptide repeat protein, partial [Cyanobacteria bacterium]|nr:tetratricopeptide repeat protein [Cyanobacteriota bacterium]
ETLVNLASTYCGLNRCEEADPLFEEGIRTLEYTVDPIHKELIEALESYVIHLGKMGQTDKAEQVSSDIKRFKSRKTHRF